MTWYQKTIKWTILAMLLLTPLTLWTITKDNLIIKETILQSLFFFCLTIWILEILETKNYRINFGPLGIPILLYGLAMLISFFGETNFAVCSAAFLECIIYLGFYFLAVNYLDNEDWQQILTILWVVLVIVNIYGIAQHFGKDIFQWATNFGRRSFATFGNPNFLAGYLVVTLPLLLSGVFYFPQRIKKFVSGILFIVTTGVLLLTQTRGAIIAFFLSMLFWTICFFIAKRKKLILAVALAGIVLAFGAGGFYLHQQRLRLFDLTGISMRARFFKWYTALEMVKDHPVKGVGIGNLKVNYALYQVKARERIKIPLPGTSESQAHNEYLQVWAETGTLGLLTFLGIFGIYFLNRLKQVAGHRPQATSERTKFLLMGSLSAVFGTLIFCLTNFPLRICPTAALFWIIMGISSRHLPVRQARSDGSIGYKTPSPLKGEGRGEGGKYPRPSYVWCTRTLAAILWLLIFSKLILPRFAAEVYRKKGDIYQLQKNYPAAVAAYEKAIALDYPHSERTYYDLGMGRVKLKDWDKAIDAFKGSISLRNYGEVYNDLANCYYLKGNYPEALKNWEFALKLGGLVKEEDRLSVEQSIRTLRKNH